MLRVVQITFPRSYFPNEVEAKLAEAVIWEHEPTSKAKMQWPWGKTQPTLHLKAKEAEEEFCQAHGAESLTGWKVFINYVCYETGSSNSTYVSRCFMLHLPEKGDTTVECFMTELNTLLKNKGKSSVGMIDLSVFDQSELGKRVRTWGGLVGIGYTSEWKKSHPIPLPKNCKWYPSPSDRKQNISEAGLCDGAQLAVVSRSRVVG